MISLKIGSKIFIASLPMAALLFLPAASLAGPQSLLDPYANIEPNIQSPTKALGERTSHKKSDKHKQVKSATVPQQTKVGETPKPAQTASNNPGFMSGMKEIQHGCTTSFKSAGHAIVNGSKSAGATIAAGGGKVKQGFSAAGHKIGSGSKSLMAKTPHIKKQKQKIASNNSAMRSPAPAVASNMGAMPGRPLGEVNSTVPHAAKVKTPKLGAGQKAPGKKNLVARTFDKFNIFNKHKKLPPNITAANQNIIPR